MGYRNYFGGAPILWPFASLRQRLLRTSWTSEKQNKKGHLYFHDILMAFFLVNNFFVINFHFNFWAKNKGHRKLFLKLDPNYYLLVTKSDSVRVWRRYTVDGVSDILRVCTLCHNMWLAVWFCGRLDRRCRSSY